MYDELNRIIAISFNNNYSYLIKSKYKSHLIVICDYYYCLRYFSTLTVFLKT